MDEERPILMSRSIRCWLGERRFRAMVRELQALSPAELRVLGIPRSQIDEIALKVFLAEMAGTPAASEGPGEASSFSPRRLFEPSEGGAFANIRLAHREETK